MVVEFAINCFLSFDLRFVVAPHLTGRFQGRMVCVLGFACGELFVLCEVALVVKCHLGYWYTKVLLYCLYFNS